MVARNLPEGMEGKFVCFSWKGDDLDPRITHIRSNYDPSHFKGEKTLVLPLGCVIVGPLDKIMAHPIFDEKIPSIWELSALFPGQIVNYQEGVFPKGAKIVIFRGMMPWHCTDWVKEVYKIGGGTVAELEFISNVGPEMIIKNIRLAHQRPNATWIKAEDIHEGRAIIVAGGPSLKRTVHTIKRMQVAGAKVFALNRVAAFLRANGITPDAQVVLDAHPDECVTFVDKSYPCQRYYASQCDPAVLDAAGDELILWDSFMQGILDVVPDAPGPFVGGGTTVGTRAIGLCYMLGYRKVHVFGLDSSIEDGEGHAYSQIEFPSVLDVVFNGKSYKTPPQFLAQVEEFRELLPELLANRCELTIHGDGLLPDVAQSMLPDPEPIKETA
jgi:uncharacterized Rossmann fold enzyme